MKKIWFLFVLFFGILLIDLTLLNLLKEKIQQRDASLERNENVSLSLLEEKEQTTKGSPLSLVFVGDINLGREINWQIQNHGLTEPILGEELENLLKSSDLAIANLESPLVKDCPPTRTGMKFCGQPTNLLLLKSAGFDLFNLANNHISNYGNQGRLETTESLQKEGLGHFGENEVAYRQIKDKRITFLGFDDTIKPIDKDFLQSKIAELAKKTDLIIINFHWGIEYQIEPSERQKELAYLAIDSGADLIIGHHPHVLQTIEYHKEKPIVYSLGNFLFDQLWSDPTRKGGVVKAIFEEGNSPKIQLFETWINDNYRVGLLNEN